jgi:hypothetical protein
MSPEHVFPEWMGRLLPNYGKGTHQRWSSRQETRTWKNDPFTDTVKCVCYPCNTTWMSHLEGRAKPYLKRPLLGYSATLSPAGQRVVAEWAFKTALMISCATYDANRPTDSYRYFYEHRRPQPETRIWIGTFFSNPPTTYQTHVGLLLGEGPKAIQRTNGFLSTFAVGHLAFHVFGVETSQARHGSFEGKLARSLVPVWPVGPRVEWPPEFFLTPDDLDTLTKSFGQVPIPKLPAP